MRARHENAVTLDSLAASRVTAETIGGKASRSFADSTVAPFQAIGTIARDIVDGLDQRPRIGGTLGLRWSA